MFGNKPKQVMIMQYQFLLNSLGNSDHISSALVDTGIKEKDIHFVSEKKDDFTGHHVHEASIFEERDLFHSCTRMGFVGLLIGIAVCFGVTVAQPYGWQPTVINYAFFCLLFVGFGGWIGGLSGISHRNYRINEYQNELEQGHALMLVYTDKSHEEGMQQVIGSNFPDVRNLRKTTEFDNPLISAKTVELDH